MKLRKIEAEMLKTSRGFFVPFLISGSLVQIETIVGANTNTSNYLLNACWTDILAILV